MVVCRYFMQGRCKYGDKCRYEHPTGGAEMSGQRVQFRDSFGNSQQNQYKWSAGQQTTQTQQSNATDVVNGLPKEMQTWEQSKMWPFSCVAMEKDMPSLPDFLDVSPEELRLQAYTAMKDGSMQTYISKIQELVVDYNNKRHQLKLPTMELKQNLIQLLEQQRKKESDSLMKSSTFGASSSSSFGNTSGTSLFGKPVGSSAPAGFGSSVTNQGLFGSSTANQGAFGSGASSSSMFGGGGGTAGSSMFGNTASTSAGMFGSPQATTASTSAGMFGSPQATTASATSGLFGASPAQSSFGASASPMSSFGNSLKTNLFEAGTTSSPFGAGSFGASQQAATQAQPPTDQGASSAASPPRGLFGNAPAPATAAPQSGNLLLAAAPQKESSVSTVYTPMDKLTEDDKAQFLAQAFTLGKVPMKPPPREMIM